MSMMSPKRRHGFPRLGLTVPTWTCAHPVFYSYSSVFVIFDFLVVVVVIVHQVNIFECLN